MFLLDTDIASAVIKDRTLIGNYVHLLNESEWAISAVTQMELRFGMLSMPPEHKTRRLVANFLMHAPAVAFDNRAADETAKIRAQLKRDGAQIGFYDPLIAGHAMALGAILVTANTKHFSSIEGLETTNWLK
jgi:tRNA(fMet)-specific endonuclease VapC